MKKTITLDATPFIFNFGGVGRATQTLFETMLGCDSEFEFNLYARCLKGKSIDCPSDVKRMRRLRLPKKAEPLIARLGLIERLVSADLYHATDHYLPLNKPEKSVVTIHDLLFMVRPEAGWGIHDHQRKVVPPFAKQCRQIITCSEYTKKDIVNELHVSPELIHVIPWGIDRDTFKPVRDQQQLIDYQTKELGITYPYFLAVGCNMDRKNTPKLLAAYEQIIKDSPNNHLVLVWDPPAPIREKYSRPPYSDYIHFTGRVSEEALVALYQGATSTVYPSDYEGFGLPVLESLACGSPIITSDRSSLPEVGGDVAIYVNPDDVSSIRDAMLEFENGNFDRLSLQQRGYEQCDKFSWEQCAQKTLDVYRLALESR